MLLNIRQVYLYICNLLKLHFANCLILIFLLVGGRKLRDVECIIEKCSDLVQMVNTDKHYDLLTETFNAITVTFFIYLNICILLL